MLSCQIFPVTFSIVCINSAQDDCNGKTSNTRRHGEQHSLRDSMCVVPNDARRLETAILFNTLPKASGALASGKACVLSTDDWAAADASAAEIMATLRRSNSEAALQTQSTLMPHYNGGRPVPYRDPPLSARSSLPSSRSGIGEGG